MNAERLAVLRTAADGCILRGHPEWVLSLRADELSWLLDVAAWYEEMTLRIPAPYQPGAPDVPVPVPAADFAALGESD